MILTASKEQKAHFNVREEETITNNVSGNKFRISQIAYLIYEDRIQNPTYLSHPYDLGIRFLKILI